MKHIRFIFLLMISATAHAQSSNYQFSHTDSTTAPGAAIWAIWTDVPNWKVWDSGLKDAEITGDFVVGATGKLIPQKGPVSAFKITAIVPDSSYTLETKIPLGRLIVKRTLTVKNGKTFFTHDVRFTGPLKRLFGRLLGKSFRAMLPGVLTTIRQLAEKK